MKPALFTSIARADSYSGKKGTSIPLVKQYAKKYLVQEGFLEQALGILDPTSKIVPSPLKPHLGQTLNPGLERK